MRPLGVALALSILLHAIIFMPGFARAMTNEDRDGLAERDAEEHPPPERPRDLRLGIAESSKTTINWIGYKEYEEHLARLAEIDQAALRLETAGSEGPPATEPVPESAQTVAMAPEPAPPLAPPAAAEDPVERPADGAPPPPPAEPVQTVLREDPEVLPPEIEGPPAPPAESVAVETETAAEEEPPPPAEAPPTETTPTETTPAEPTPAETTPAEATPAETAPTPPAPAAGGGGEGAGSDSIGPGERSEAEADATSIQNVPTRLWKNGRPIAAEGLTIRTRRPRFTTLTMVTVRPINPVVEIRFDADGRPRSYRYLRPAGHPDVDGPILDAIAGWRATGVALDALRPGETVAVRLRLMLTD